MKRNGKLMIVIDVPRRGRERAESPCLRDAATSPRYYISLANAALFRAAMRRLEADIYNIFLRDLQIRWDLPDSVAFVDGSATPALTSGPDAQGLLMWRSSHVTQQGLTVTLRLRPTGAGLQQLADSVTIIGADNLGGVDILNVNPPETVILGTP